MHIASADQYRIYRRRSIGALLIEIVAALLSGIAVIVVFILLGDQGVYPKVIAAISLLSVFFLGQAARRLYFRCPVCTAPLPRGPRQVAFGEFFNGYCSHCDTKFAR